MKDAQPRAGAYQVPAKGGREIKRQSAYPFPRRCVDWQSAKGPAADALVLYAKSRPVANSQQPSGRVNRLKRYQETDRLRPNPETVNRLQHPA
jgi:hypothetical protein